jgi:hypothetical protein
MNSYLKKILELDLGEGGAGANGSSNEDEQASHSGPAVVSRGRGRGRGGRVEPSGDEVFGGLTEKQTKKMIEQKLAPKKKRRKLGGENPNGMTEEELIAE